MMFSTELEPIIQKFIWNYKRPRIANAILRIKNKQEENSPRLQTILQSYSNQESVVLVQKRHMDQWNRIESPEINTDTYSQSVFDNGSKNVKWEKVSSVSGAGKTV